jgi:hypothetical protein
MGGGDCISNYNKRVAKVQQQRLEARGGAQPLPHAERHRSCADQHALDTSAEAVIAAHDCLRDRPCCKLSICKAVVKDIDFIRACLEHRHTLTGQRLFEMASEAVVEHEGTMELIGLVTIEKGVKVCFPAFCVLYAIKPWMRGAMRKAVREGRATLSDKGMLTELDETLTKPRDMVTKHELARSWFRVYAGEVGDHVPNCNVIHMDMQNRVVLWQLFVYEQRLADLIFDMSYSHFCDAAKEESNEPPRITMRDKKAVSSVCAICMELYAALQSALASKVRADIERAKAALKAHFQYVRRLRQSYFITAASASSGNVLSVIQDGMDQAKCCLPSVAVAKQCNELNGKRKLPIHVQGLKVHGTSKPVFLFCLPPWVPGNGNMASTTLLHTLTQLAARGMVLPDTICAQVDGGKENWNWTFFAFIAVLIILGIFKKAMISRQIVGHTHLDMDQVFSDASRYMHGTGGHENGHDALTPEELFACLRRCRTVSPNVEPMNHLFDFTAWLEPVRAVLSGYGASSQLVICENGEAQTSRQMSHFLVAKICVHDGAAPGTLPTIKFAQDSLFAQDGKWAPFSRDDGGVKWSPDNEPGYDLFTAAPSGKPQLVAAKPSDWDDLTEFRTKVLASVTGHPKFPPSVMREWNVRMYARSFTRLSDMPPPFAGVSVKAAICYGRPRFRRLHCTAAQLQSRPAPAAPPTARRTARAAGGPHPHQGAHESNEGQAGCKSARSAGCCGG